MYCAKSQRSIARYPHKRFRRRPSTIRLSRKTKPNKIGSVAVEKGGGLMIRECCSAGDEHRWIRGRTLEADSSQQSRRF